MKVEVAGRLGVHAATMATPSELHLIRDWDAAWDAVVRPWLAAPAVLRRDYVVVPTRGQAHGLKLRCVREGLPLLGVEFLTPRLARQKWLAFMPPRRPALGRELLLLNVRALIEERLAGLAAEDAAWGLWKSLQSDAERALDDFDELLRAGLTAEDFPLPALRGIFGALERQVERLGYDFASRQDHRAGQLVKAGKKLGGRLMLYGFTAEHRPHLPSLLALAHHAETVSVLVPEPEFGRKDHDERWIESWETALAVTGLPLDEPEQDRPGARIAQLWGGGSESRGEEEATLLIGQSRGDEIRLVADEIARRLAAGAGNVAVVFPAAGSAHLRLSRLLAERNLPFNDLLEAAGPVAVDTQLQRALLAFYEQGCRVEELLALWPFLQARNSTTLSPGAARDVAERAFDARQSHSLALILPDLAARERPDWKEVARVAGLLLPAWPDQLTLADALARFAHVCARFQLPEPETWPALAAYAALDDRNFSTRLVAGTLASFLPEKGPVPDAPGRGLFAPVTLTTWRRAATLAWSDVIFVQSNAGIWPVRSESSCWLTDEQKGELSRRDPAGGVLFTGDSRAWLEREGYTGIARSTAGQVAFSAALFDDDEPELKLAPNAWLERVILHGQRDGKPDADLAPQARVAAIPLVPPATETCVWFQIWQRRRDPAAAFDNYFLSGDPGQTRPAALAARLIERAIQDPAELWFGGVLELQRVDWRPLVRARKKSLGSLVHRVLASALRGPPVEGAFRELPAPDDAQVRLAAELAALRAQWPRDRYWDSFHAELAEMALVLLAQVYRLPVSRFVAVETKLPEDTTIVLGPGGTRVGVIGRMDLVLSDRPEWGGATVEVVDFKTGADTRLSVKAMAGGASLQLGVYLAAAASMGVGAGRVWMLKPDGAKPVSLDLGELSLALAALAQLERHLLTGRYGALTADRTDFSHGFDWPLACVPIRQAILRQKFAVTFGAPTGEEEETTDE